jgi:hypothetical protein
MSRNEDRWGDCVGGPYPGFRYFLCDRGKFSTRPLYDVQHSRGIWTLDSEGGIIQLYVNCHTCGRPNNISNHYIHSSTGRCNDACVICTNTKCRIHFFPQLVGWRSSLAQKVGTRVVLPKKKEA